MNNHIPSIRIIYGSPTTGKSSICKTDPKRFFDMDEMMKAVDPEFFNQRKWNNPLLKESGYIEQVRAKAAKHANKLLMNNPSSILFTNLYHDSFRALFSPEFLESGLIPLGFYRSAEGMAAIDANRSQKNGKSKPNFDLAITTKWYDSIISSAPNCIDELIELQDDEFMFDHLHYIIG